MELENKNNFITYKNENKLMNMIAIPYFGVYSPNYTFYIPTLVLHSKNINDKILNNFPILLQNHFQEMNKDFNVDYDYFVVNLDGSFLCNKYLENTKNGLVRINFVPHPYIFYDVNKLEKDHKTVIFSILYTDQETYNNLYNSNNCIREVNESDGMRINWRNKIICNENQKEIILHKSDDNFPALSPNNSAFLANIHSTNFTLFNLTLVTYKNQIVKFMIGQYNFFNQNNFNLYKNILSFDNFKDEVEIFYDLLLNKELIQFTISNIFSYFLYQIKNVKDQNKIKEIIKNIFQIIFIKNPDFSYDMNLLLHLQSQESINEMNFSYLNDNLEIKKIGDFYYNDICFFLYDNFGRPDVTNLGERLLFSKMIEVDKNNIFSNEISNSYLIEILLKYSRKFITNINKILDSQINILELKYNLNSNDEKIQNEIKLRFYNTKDKFIKLYYQEISKQNNCEYDKFIEICEEFNNNLKIKFSNNALNIFREMLEESFNQNFERIKEKVNDLDDIYQNLLYYKVWERKGKIVGIHQDFGRLSLIRSNQIPSNYFCDAEELVEILLEITGIIETFDNK